MGTRNDEAKDAALSRLAALDVFPGQHYQHYKTLALYTVIAVGLFETTLEPLVHYRALNEDYAVVWTRTLDAFCGKVVQDGALVRRFLRVE